MNLIHAINYNDCPPATGSTLMADNYAM